MWFVLGELGVVGCEMSEFGEVGLSWNVDLVVCGEDFDFYLENNGRFLGYFKWEVVLLYLCFE